MSFVYTWNTSYF